MKLSRALKGINGRRYSKEGGEGEKDGATILTFFVSLHYIYIYIHIYVVYIKYIHTHKTSLYTNKTQCVCVYDMYAGSHRGQKRCQIPRSWRHR